MAFTLCCFLLFAAVAFALAALMAWWLSLCCLCLGAFVAIYALQTGLLVCRVHAHLLDQPCCDPCAGAHGRDNSFHHQKSCLLHCRNKGKLLSRSLHMPAHHTKSTAVLVITGPTAPMIKRYTDFQSNKISVVVVADSAYLMMLL